MRRPEGKENLERLGAAGVDGVGREGRQGEGGWSGRKGLLAVPASNGALAINGTGNGGAGGVLHGSAVKGAGALSGSKGFGGLGGGLSDRKGAGAGIPGSALKNWGMVSPMSARSRKSVPPGLGREHLQSAHFSTKKLQQTLMKCESLEMDVRRICRTFVEHASKKTRPPNSLSKSNFLLNESHGRKSGLDEEKQPGKEQKDARCILDYYEELDKEITNRIQLKTKLSQKVFDMLRECKINSATEEQISQLLEWKLESLNSLATSLVNDLTQTQDQRQTMQDELAKIASKNFQQKQALELALEEEKLLLHEMADADRRLEESEGLVETLQKERIELLAIQQAGGFLPEPSVTSKSTVSLKSKSGIEQNTGLAFPNERLSVVARCYGKPSELEGSEEEAIEILDNKSIMLKQTTKQSDKLYSFDRVFGSEDTQATVFDYLEDMLTMNFEGFQTCVISHGGLLSGKSYSIFGKDSEESEGIAFRTLKLIDTKIRSFKDSAKVKFTVTYSFTEVYNDKLLNLLDERKSEQLGVPFVRIAEDAPEFLITRLSMMIRKGLKRRVMRKNTLGQTLSKSHTVLTIGIRSKQENSEDSFLEKWGDITFVDLASPDKNADLADFEKKNEQSTINKSLINLQTVLKAIKSNSQHVPYRSNKLTAFLQPTLAKCAKCVILMHLQTSKKQVSHTKNSLDLSSELTEPQAPVQQTSNTQKPGIVPETSNNSLSVSEPAIEPQPLVRNVALTPRADASSRPDLLAGTKSLPVLNLNASKQH